MVRARYVHTNLIARDWRRLAAFYQAVFGCEPVPPERDQSGPWLEQATGLAGAHLRGVHLRLPGLGDDGPTLEIYQYEAIHENPPVAPNTAGYGHLAFAVDDVAAVGEAILERGGSAVGPLTEVDVEAGRLTFRYMRDPEGNILEIQRWG